MSRASNSNRRTIGGFREWIMSSQREHGGRHPGVWPRALPIPAVNDQAYRRGVGKPGMGPLVSTGSADGQKFLQEEANHWCSVVAEMLRLTSSSSTEICLSRRP